jgi:hypothetical protein
MPVRSKAAKPAEGTVRVQPLRVLAIVLLRPKDQPQSARMRHHDPRGDRAQQVVVVAVAASLFEADRPWFANGALF